MSNAKKAIVFICFLAISVSVTADDWPNWRGPEHNGISKEKDWNPAALNDDTRPVWEKNIGTGFSSISVADGKVYTMGNIDDKDIVYCFDAKTGREIWVYSYASKLNPKYYEGGPSATPTVADGKVYTVSKTGQVYCLDAKTGDVLWHEKLQGEEPTWGISGSAFISGDLAIFNAGKHGVGLDKNTGDLKWQNGQGPSGYSTAVPYKYKDKDAVVLFGPKEVLAVIASNGQKIWEYSWETKYDVNAADPIIDGDKIFITSGYGHGCALIDVTDGQAKKVWKNKNMRSQMSGPVLWKGYLYGMDDSRLACVDMKTGEKMWSNKASGKGSLMLADGKLIILSEKGRLIIAEATPEEYKEISSARLLKGRCWSMPVLANGRIFARSSAKGKLICVDVSIKD